MTDRPIAAVLAAIAAIVFVAAFSAAAVMRPNQAAVAENGSSPVVTEKLLAATSTDTVRSRAYTGKPARQLRTAWTEAWEAPESPGTLPMPLQFILNSYANQKMGATPPKELVGMPVGQIVSRMDKVRSTKQVVVEMVDEYVETASRLMAGLEG